MLISLDSITSNDAFSDDDESLVFDNLEEVDTPEAVDHNVDISTKHQTSSGNPTQTSTPSLPHGPTQGQSSRQSHHFSGNYSGISTPPGMAATHQQPLPAHLPIHLHPQSHPPMGVGISEVHTQQQPPHLPQSENGLQNPIDKLYLMQDSYFTQM